MEDIELEKQDVWIYWHKVGGEWQIKTATNIIDDASEWTELDLGKGFVRHYQVLGPKNSEIELIHNGIA